MFGVGVAFHVKAMCLTIYSTKKVLTKNNLNKKKLELRRKSSISLDHPAHTCPCEKNRLNEEKRKRPQREESHFIADKNKNEKEKHQNKNKSKKEKNKYKIENTLK